MSTPDPSVDAGSPSLLRRLVPVGAVLAFIGLVVGSVVAFQSPNDSRSVSGDPELRDGIRVRVNVVKVIPDADHLIARMAFEPVGSFVKDRRFLAKPVRVVIAAGASVVDETYNAGEIMPPEDVEVALEGDIAEFPFDHYDGTFQVNVKTAEGAAAPSVLLADASVHGYRLTATDPVSEFDGGNDMTIDVWRSSATIIFGFFVMGLMWALTALVVTMAAVEIYRREPIDAPLIGFLGVLLFAFPAIRNSVPNSPPLGVLSDFASYFWCEMALGVTLVAILAVQAKRRFSPKPPTVGG